jgi:hypothetical protein
MTNSIEVARELLRLFWHIDNDKDDPAAFRGAIRALESKFPGLTKGEVLRALNVMLAQAEMFMEDVDERLAKMKAVVNTYAVLDGGLPAELRATFEKADGEFEAMVRDFKNSPADSLFPTKPDKSKS